MPEAGWLVGMVPKTHTPRDSSGESRAQPGRCPVPAVKLASIEMVEEIIVAGFVVLNNLKRTAVIEYGPALRSKPNTTQVEVSLPIVVNVWWRSLAHDPLPATSASPSVALPGARLPVTSAKIGKIPMLTDATIGV